MVISDNLKSIHNFIEKHPIAIIYISSTTCNVCKSLKPRVLDLVNNYNLAELLSVDIDRFPELTGSFGVYSLPTLFVFVKGLESARFSRNFGLNELENILDRYSQIIS